jgi:hypothetical protein
MFRLTDCVRCESLVLPEPRSVTVKRSLLGTILVRISVTAPANASKIYCDFPQSFQVNADRTVPVQSTKS